MRFLLFDVKPWPDAIDRYLDIAASLRPRLDESGGCEYLDRFRRVAESDADNGWLLSFQYWRNEQSLARWRKNGAHHNAQETRRVIVFEDYRLRVGEILRSKTPTQTATQLREAPRQRKFVVMIETKLCDFATERLNPVLRFESIYRPGSFLHVGNTASYREALLYQRFASMRAPTDR